MKVPPMVPSAEERLNSEPSSIEQRRLKMEKRRVFLDTSVIQVQDRAYRDGFAAALAMLNAPDEEWETTAVGDNDLANKLAALACPLDCPNRYGDEPDPGSCGACYDTVCKILRTAASALAKTEP